MDHYCFKLKHALHPIKCSKNATRCTVMAPTEVPVSRLKLLYHDPCWQSCNPINKNISSGHKPTSCKTCSGIIQLMLQNHPQLRFSEIPKCGVSILLIKEKRTSPAQQQMQRLQKLIRGLTVQPIHLRLQLPQLDVEEGRFCSPRMDSKTQNSMLCSHLPITSKLITNN